MLGQVRAPDRTGKVRAGLFTCFVEPGGNGGSGVAIIRYKILPPSGTVFMMR